MMFRVLLCMLWWLFMMLVRIGIPTCLIIIWLVWVPSCALLDVLGVVLLKWILLPLSGVVVLPLP
jgi:hypothetical protein